MLQGRGHAEASVASPAESNDPGTAGCSYPVGRWEVPPVYELIKIMQVSRVMMQHLIIIRLGRI